MGAHLGKYLVSARMPLWTLGASNYSLFVKFTKMTQSFTKNDPVFYKK